MRENVEYLKTKRFEVRAELDGFRNRRLFFVTGPEDITVELAQWD